MKVVEIIEDSVVYKGVIVSKDGIIFAKCKNIGLVKLNEIKRNENERIEIIKPNLISRLVGGEEILWTNRYFTFK